MDNNKEKLTQLTAKIILFYVLVIIVLFPVWLFTIFGSIIFSLLVFAIEMVIALSFILGASN